MGIGAAYKMIRIKTYNRGAPIASVKASNTLFGLEWRGRIPVNENRLSWYFRLKVMGRGIIQSTLRGTGNNT